MDERTVGVLGGGQLGREIGQRRDSRLRETEGRKWCEEVWEGTSPLGHDQPVLVVQG